MNIIFGYWSRSQRNDPQSILNRMERSVNVAGFHNTEVFIDCDFSIGYGSNIIIPSEKGIEACNLDFSDILLTFIGRIDNRDELIESLDIQNDNQIVNDRYLVLAAFRKWGTCGFKRLIGDFVIVIWNKKEKRLICVVDPIGLNPFYYALISNGDFIFATKIRTILSSQIVETKINELFIVEYLLRYFFSREDTGYVNIKKLAPGNYLSVTPHKFENINFFSFDNIPQLNFKTTAQYAEGFRECLGRAVKDRMQNNTKIGAALSGGLDSSSICSLGANLSYKELHTFSAVFPNLPKEESHLIDERGFIDELLKRYSFSPHFVNCSISSPLAHLDYMLDHIDNLFWGTNLYISYELYRKAKEQGIGTFLIGLDGDTVVSHGFEIFPHLLLNFNWFHLFKEFRCYFRRINQSFLKPSNWWQLVFSPVIDPLIGKLFPAHIFKNLNILSKDILNRYQIKELLVKHLQPFKDARQDHLNAVTAPLFPYIFEMETQLANSFGIELCCPFFDRRVVEFCLGVPIEQKFRNGWPRYLLRESMKGILPEKIRTRLSKGNLGVNFYRRFIEDDCGQLDITRDLLLLAPFVDSNYLKTLKNFSFDKLKRFHQVSLQEMDNVINLFSLYLLLKWLQKNFEWGE